MANVWQLQEAKARLSEIVKLCSEKGPQVLSVHGVEKVVLISKQEYDRLVGPKENFVEFMKRSPFKGFKLELERDKSVGRDIDL